MQKINFQLNPGFQRFLPIQAPRIPQKMGGIATGKIKASNHMLVAIIRIESNNKPIAIPTTIPRTNIHAEATKVKLIQMIKAFRERLDDFLFFLWWGVILCE